MIIFSQACDALKTANPLLKVRPLSEATKTSKVKARKSIGEWLFSQGYDLKCIPYRYIDYSLRTLAFISIAICTHANEFCSVS